MEELKIGIVAEGISDYWVLKHLIERMLRNKDPHVISLQPKVLNGKQDGFGGWLNVFNYIENKEYIIDLAQTEEFDYIVVQIDTDVSIEYGVTKSADNAQLYLDVVKAINDRVHIEFDKSKLIFAICIDSTECWLIPFVSTKLSECKKTTNCVNVVNKEIRRKYGTIDADNKGNAKPQYDEILRLKKKARDIRAISLHNYGFSKFIESLDEIIIN